MNNLQDIAGALVFLLATLILAIIVGVWMTFRWLTSARTMRAVWDDFLPKRDDFNY